jgi:hypothetical protein
MDDADDTATSLVVCYHHVQKSLSCLGRATPVVYLFSSFKHVISVSE